MIKKAIIIVICIGAVSATAQQQQQQAYGNIFTNIGLGNQAYVQRQNNPVVLASNRGNSNMQLKTNQTNKVVRRAPIQQTIPRNINPQIQPLVQNEDLPQVLINIAENNIGNEMSTIQQIASVELPTLQIANGMADLNLEMNMPKINLNLNRHVVKSRATSNSSKYKLFQVEKKLKKMNRKLSAKLNSNKKLRIKVDNCFKW